MDSHDLDMEGVLIGWQARQVSPSTLAEIAASELDRGKAGPETADVGRHGRAAER
jgi:hypothetical protein